jgi:hypothetical protein
MQTEEILIKRNLQIDLKTKIAFYIFSILTPLSLLLFLTELDMWIKIMPALLLLILGRKLLDLPPEFQQLDFALYFKPIKSLKSIVQLLKPTDSELNQYSILKFIFYLSIVSYIVFRLFLLILIIGLIILIVLK